MEVGEITRAGAKRSGEAGEKGGFGGRVVERQVGDIVEIGTHLISTIDESRSGYARLAWYRATRGVEDGAKNEDEDGDHNEGGRDGDLAG